MRGRVLLLGCLDRVGGRARVVGAGVDAPTGGPATRVGLECRRPNRVVYHLPLPGLRLHKLIQMDTLLLLILFCCCQVLRQP